MPSGGGPSATILAGSTSGAGWAGPPAAVLTVTPRRSWSLRASACWSSWPVTTSATTPSARMNTLVGMPRPTKASKERPAGSKASR
jgi:hypothetical protein